MKIRLLTQYEGPHGLIQPGQIVDLDAKVALKLIEYRNAISAEPMRKESAVLRPDGETATLK